jgi:hypothetical protein
MEVPVVARASSVASLLCLVLVFGANSAVAEQRDGVSGHGNGSGPKLEQLSLAEATIGSVAGEHDMHVSVSALVLRGAYWGPLGVELQVFEWLHPGGSANRDKHSFLPVYLHVFPWVLRRGSSETPDGRFRVYILDAFVGGSAWAFRTDNDIPGVVDEPEQGWDWGHQYLRAGVRLSRATEEVSLGVEYGVAVSRADGGPDVGDVSHYLAAYMAIGFTR